MRIDRIVTMGIMTVLLTACTTAGVPAAVGAPTAAPAVAPVTTFAVAAPTLAIGPDAPRPDPDTVPVPPAGACHIVDGIADHICTPGLVNPGLTAAELCAAGFSTSTIRPPVSYTNVLKKRLMVSYGLTQAPEFYELDHELSLEDLGHPYDPRNLWPQPRGRTLPGSQPTGVEPNAEQKDRVESVVHRMICVDPTNATNIASLQARLVADWRQFRKPDVASLLPDDEPAKDPEP
jgi:hypothetical protein